jgi:hypothetical protein
MNFLNPLVLFGLAASAIPILLHLLNLRKLKIIDFSSLRFLKELQKSKIRRLKIKQIILLILRTLAIALVVLAFARPTIPGSLPGMASYAKTSAVILVDNSFSMDVSDEYGNRFNQARNAVNSILNAAKDGDEIAIVQMTEQSNKAKLNFSRNLQYLKEEFSRLKISAFPANLESSLRIASSLMDNASNINKEIYIVSDAQRNTFFKSVSDTFKLFDKPINIYFVPVGLSAKTDIQNLSIDSINVISKIIQKEKLIELEALIRNNSDKDVKGAVASMFFGEERIAQRALDIPANSVRQLAISATPKQYGVIKAYIELEEDALNVDNRRYFGFNIPEKPNMLLVGTPEKNTFIELAMSTKVGNETTVNIQQATPRQFPGVNLTNYDVVVIAGGPLLNTDYQRLSQYIIGGGKCLLFADNSAQPEMLRDAYSRFGLGEPNLKSAASGQPIAFSSVDKTHPVFDGVFKGTTDSKSIVESPKIYKLLACNGGQSIIQTPAGNFLSEAILGDGKLIYCAVSPSTDWSSFPVTGLFPALLFRSVYYLSSRDGIGTNINVGTPYMLMLPKQYSTGGTFKINDPNNVDYFMQSLLLPSGAALSLEYLKFPGIYSIKSNLDKVISVVSVNTDPSESIIKTLSAIDIEKSLKTILSDKAKLHFIEPNKNIMQSVYRERSGTELWQLFVLLALLCVISEMIIAKNSKLEATEE